MKNSQLEIVDFFDSFFDHFSISLFFVKPVTRESHPIRKSKSEIIVKNSSESVAAADSSKNSSDGVWLGPEHVNLLWLIRALINTKETSQDTIMGYKVVPQEQLRKIFLWYKKADLTHLANLTYMIENLDDVGFLEIISEKRKAYYRLTEQGDGFLDQQRFVRRKNLERVFELNGIGSSQYKKILKICEKITPVLWQTIIAESADVVIPKRNQRKRKHIFEKH